MLHTRQSEIILEFSRKTSFCSYFPVDLCLEMSSDFNYNSGFVVEEIFELGHRDFILSMLKLENFLNHKSKIIIEIPSHF